MVINLNTVDLNPIQVHYIYCEYCTTVLMVAHLRPMGLTTCKVTNPIYYNVAILTVVWSRRIFPSSDLSPVHALRFSIAMQVQRSYTSPSSNEKNVDFYLLYSRSHALRYGSHYINPPSTRIELTTSALLVGMRGYHSYYTISIIDHSGLIEFSNNNSKLMSKSSRPWSQGRKTPSGRENAPRTLHAKRKGKHSGKTNAPKKRRQERIRTVV